MLTAAKLKKGMTLIEVMLAIVTLLIVIIGTSFLLAYGKGQISLRKNYRSAVNLAAQKLEQLKADDYYDMEEGETDENLSVGNLSYTLSTVTEDQGLYKNVTAVVSWIQGWNQHDVSLVTSIAPN